ncbi:MAG: hypothetical protein GY757_60805, partial [bacterium]|nr:hypothetical protein [bacterium]
DRVYRSGDLGRRLPDGSIEYAGRKDFQVKIRGYRVEPGEIEGALDNIEGVKKSAVVNKQNQDGENYLIAYYVLSEEEKGDINETKLLNRLQQELPDYMVPAAIIELDEYPLTATGKIDRKTLTMLETTGILIREYVAPRNEVEEKMAELWAEILRHPQKEIGIDAEYFQMGGHSLNAAIMATRIQNRYNVKFPLAQLFKTPTIRELSQYIQEAEREEIEHELITEQVRLLNAPAPAKLFCFPPAIAFGEAYNQLSQLITDRELYTFNFIEEEDRLQKYIQQITAIQTGGPYVLFGYSAGGRHAYEVAAEMEAQGHNVSDIIMLDSKVKSIAATPRDEEIEKVDIVGNAMKILEEYGAEFLKEKVKRKIEKYETHHTNIKPKKIITARIHLIRARQEEGKTKGYHWEKYTQKTVHTYQGSGKHNDMLIPGYLEKNGAIIREVLKKCPTPPIF